MLSEEHVAQKRPLYKGEVDAHRFPRFPRTNARYTVEQCEVIRVVKRTGPRRYAGRDDGGEGSQPLPSIADQVAVPTGRGGYKWCFQCPECGRKVRALYREPARRIIVNITDNPDKNPVVDDGGDAASLSVDPTGFKCRHCLKAIYNSQRHSPSHPTRRDSLPRFRQKMRRIDRFLAAHPEAVAKARARLAARENSDTVEADGSES